MRAIFDPATHEAVQSEAQRKTGGDTEANSGSGRERHYAQHVAAPRPEGDANPQLTGALQDPAVIKVPEYSVASIRWASSHPLSRKSPALSTAAPPRSPPL